jgi:tetratricopeptide (TPR) repeat protein
VSSSQRARRWKFAAAAVAFTAGIAVVAWRIGEYRTAPSAALVEAEHLTTNARELSRSRTRAGYAQAAALARRAIARDPSFAPAWAELALASWLPAWWDETKQAGAEAKARADSLGYLDRALKLQPHLGRAMAIRGMILGDEAATPLLEQAVIEAPDDAEAWLWLGNQRAESGLMAEALEAYRRAAELEPLWERSVGGYALAAAQLGDNDAADRAVDRFAAAAPNRFAAESLRASIARARGDLLAAARHGSLALSLAPDDPWIQMIELVLVARATGDVEAVRRITSAHADLRKRLAPLVDASGAVMRAESTVPAVWWNSALIEDEARLLLRADRPDLLLTMVAQQPLSLLELHRGRNSNGAPFGAQLILALRGSGREDEARSLFDAIHADLERLTASRHSYFDLDLGNAAAFALEGRDAEAVASLGQAIAKGWRGQMSEWAVDPGDEPVFVHLRGREDFERVRSQLSAEIGRVRPQIAEILAQTAIPVLKTAVTDDP